MHGSVFVALGLGKRPPMLTTFNVNQIPITGRSFTKVEVVAHSVDLHCCLGVTPFFLSLIFNF